MTRARMVAPSDTENTLARDARAGYCPTGRQLLIQLKVQRILAVFERAEQIGNIGMFNRLARIIGNKVLFRNVGHIKTLIVFGQQVIKRLVLDRAAFLGNRLVPVFGVGKNGIHVKDHAAKRVFLVTDNLSQMVFCTRSNHNNTIAPTL